MRELHGRRVLLYRRVSSEEQARRGYSLPAQDEEQTRFCDHNGLVIVDAYADEGVSGRDFDRPAYRRMVSEWAAPGAVDYVIVTKWSRFARNVDDARAEIRRWAERGAEVQAIEQWINYGDPNHLYQLLINLIEPDVANRWLSINVKQGMRRAMKEGRWVARPPIGYNRARDTADRAILVPCPELGSLVVAAFALAADPAIPIAEVYRRAKANGLGVARSRFFKLLRDPVYAGRIRVPAAQGEPEEEVEGLHEPIVDAATFARVQLRFERPRRVGERGPDPRLPLRGLLLCPSCRLPTSGSVSRGNGGQYAYYRCHRCRPAFSAPARSVHLAFGAHLAAVQCDPDIVALYQLMDADDAQARAEEERREAVRLRRLIQEEEARRDRAEELYLDGQFDREQLDRASVRAEERLKTLRFRLDALKPCEPADYAASLNFALTLLSDLNGVWERGDGEARRVLAGSIFPEGLVFDGEGFGTSPESEIIALLGGNTAASKTNGRPVTSSRPLGYAREDSNL